MKLDVKDRSGTTHVNYCFNASQNTRYWRADEGNIVQKSSLADQDVEQLLMDFYKLCGIGQPGRKERRGHGGIVNLRW